LFDEAGGAWEVGGEIAEGDSGGGIGGREGF